MLWQTPSKRKTLPRALGKLNPVIAQILYHRGIRTNKQVTEFFSLSYDHNYYNPLKIKNMKSAIKRVMQAARAKEKVTIFADYDADGITSATLLSGALKKIGLVTDIYIPDREKEGYGLNQKAVKKQAQQGTGLIITVDCGANDQEEVELANKLGIDLIILDHHLLSNSPPKVQALINLHQRNERYPFKDLAACGVVFKFIQALAKSLPRQLPYASLQKELDLVAVATIADMVPLLGENRILTKHGLFVLAKTKRPGLVALMKEARMRIPSIKKRGDKFFITNLDSFSIGFIIAPRLNAASRMDHGLLGYQLLTSRSQRQAQKIAQRLETKNRERQKAQKLIIEAVRRELDKLDKIPPLICRGHKKWPMGVIGIVAGVISDKYYRPTIIYHKGKKQSKASCRTIPEVNIMEALAQCKQYLIEFGGHAGAAGFTIANENLPAFEKCLARVIRKLTKGKRLMPRIIIDAELSPSEITFELSEQLMELEPFGKGNPVPRFITKKLELAECRIVGANGDHLKLRFKPASNGSYLDAIWFRNNNDDGFVIGQLYDVVYEILCDEWQGRRKLTLKVIDMKPVS